MAFTIVEWAPEGLKITAFRSEDEKSFRLQAQQLAVAEFVASMSDVFAINFAAFSGERIVIRPQIMMQMSDRPCVTYGPPDSGTTFLQSFEMPVDSGVVFFQSFEMPDWRPTNAGNAWSAGLPVFTTDS